MIRALWWFVENVTEDDPDRTNHFFALRERVREYYGHARSQLSRRPKKLADSDMGRTFAAMGGKYRILRDTKPPGRDYQDGDERSIQYISGKLHGRVIEQVFRGSTKAGGWFDL